MKIILLIASFMIAYLPMMAQQVLPFDRTSPRAEVSQKLGVFAKVSVEYSRPYVNGREVFGKLVPFGMAKDPYGPEAGMPWRTGADENTTITFSHDVIFGGENVSAGSYGVHTVPNENEWVVILNSNSSAWGSYFYDPSLDVIRVTVPVSSGAFTENFTMGFEGMTTSEMNLFMQWAETKVSVPISFDIHDVNLSEYDKLLTSLQGFNPQAFAQAAQYCVNNETNYERGLGYAMRANKMARGSNFTFVVIEAQLKELTGNTESADAIIDAGIESANERQLSAYGNWLVTSGRKDRGVDILETNAKMNSKSWQAYQVLAKAYVEVGAKKSAQSTYKKAIRLAKDDQKATLQAELDAL